MWTLVRGLPEFGPTRTSKLLARKRPGLFPIYDSVIAVELGITTPAGHWSLTRELASRDNGALIAHASRLATDASVDPVVTPLRVIDIVLWRHSRDTGITSAADL